MPARDDNYVVKLQNNVMVGPKLKPYLPQKGIGQYIYNGCEEYPENIQQSCPYENKSVTFNDFKTLSMNIAANMQRLYGIQQGDIVLTCMKNSLQTSLPVAATFYLGGIISAVDPTQSVRDCEHLVNLVKPKIIFVDEDSLPTITTTLKNIQFQTVVVVNEAVPNLHHFDGCIELAKLMEENEKNDLCKPVVIENEDDTTAVILFSSGTTGLPKGICLSHKSVIQGSINFVSLMNNPQVYAYITTFYWISGLLMFVGQFTRGATRVLLRHFDVEQLCQTISDYKVEGLFIATSLGSKMLQMKNFGDKYNLESWTTTLFGGTAATREAIAKLHQTFPEIMFSNVYGMTELGTAVTVFPKNQHSFADYPDSVGTVVPGCSIKIVDLKTGQNAKPNEKGEIRIKSDYKMIGYYNYTSDDSYDSEGFLKSGDIGYYDEHNYLYISGRIKDMFKYQSWHIVPASIEAIIKEHPAIEEAIVFGIPHGEDGFLPSAAITFNKQYAHNTEPKDIADFVAERVADRQKLRGGVYIVAEMPKTPTGKVQRMKVLDVVMQTIEH